MQSSIGQTPVFDFGLQTFAKLEGENFTGSMKVRPAKMIIDHMPRRVGMTVIESTSGNMGVGLAAVCNLQGIPVELVVDPKLSPYHREEMLKYGAKLIEVTEVDDTGGWLKTRLQEVRRRCCEVPKYFWTDQYGSPFNPAAYEALVDELCIRLPFRNCKTVHLYGAVSTGGSLSGTAYYLKKRLPSKRVRVVAVDAVGSVIFGQQPKTRYLNGMGSSLKNPPNLNRNLIDAVSIVSDEEAFDWCYWLLDRYKIWVGGSSGAVWAAYHKETAKGMFSYPDDLVVMLFPDHGRIYEKTLYDKAWLNERGFDFNAMGRVVRR